MCHLDYDYHTTVVVLPWKIFDKEVRERAVRGCIVEKQMDKEVVGQLFPYVGYHITWKRNVCQELPGHLFEKNSLQCGARDLSELIHLRIWAKYFKAEGRELS